MSEREGFSKRQVIKEGIKDTGRSLIAPAGLGVESAGLLLDSRPLMVGGWVIIGAYAVKVIWEFSQSASKVIADYRRGVRENRNQRNDKNKQS